MSGLPSFNLAATIEKVAGPVSNGYAARLRTDSLNEVVIAVMVEKRECVEDLDAILAVEGLEMVQFGASDFSMSLGLTGQRNHPDVVRAERLTIEKGLHPRVEFADIKQAAPYLEMGVKHFCIGGDVRILHDWWWGNGEGMRAMVPAARGQTCCTLAGRLTVAATRQRGVFDVYIVVRKSRSDARVQRYLVRNVATPTAGPRSSHAARGSPVRQTHS
jgi:hypothetical protein